MKKVIAVVLILAIVGAAAWLILLRPSDFTEDSLVSLFEDKKDSFTTMADYLTENNVNTVIDGLISIDDRRGVPIINENRYRAFNDANTILMREKIDKIVAGGDTVEFVFLDEGGLINRMNARIVYSREKPADAARTLSVKDWYLCIA